MRITWPGFVIEAIEELDLEPFYAAYRADGHGRAVHDPKMMLTLLAYAYCVGERNSRGIERRCREDVAFRVICANRVPDHATIARFRVRHQEALAGLFSQVLGLCAQAGLVRVGVIAVVFRRRGLRPGDPHLRGDRRRGSRRGGRDRRRRGRALRRGTGRRAARASEHSRRQADLASRGEAAPRGRASREPRAGSAGPGRAT
jgi:Transposase domain (DUF772)